MAQKKGMFILFHGEPSAGKDVAGDYIVKKYGYTKISYAKPLKDHVAPLYNLDRKDMDSEEGKLTPLLRYPLIVTNRLTRNLVKEVYQYLRTIDGERVENISEIGTDRPDHKLYIHDENDPQNTKILYQTPRSILIWEGCLKVAVDPYFWPLTAYKELPDEGPLNVVVTDFRFPEEYYCTLEMYGKSAFVFPILIHNPDKENKSTSVSQTSLSAFRFDYNIENRKKSLEDLYSKIDQFMELFASSGYQ